MFLNFSGFAGVFCDRPCSDGTWGVDCKEKCQCLNNAACHPQNGTKTFMIKIFTFNVQNKKKSHDLFLNSQQEHARVQLDIMVNIVVINVHMVFSVTNVNSCVIAMKKILLTVMHQLANVSASQNGEELNVRHDVPLVTTVMAVN